MWGNTWDLEYCGNINGNSEAEANRLSLTRDSGHSCISEGAGGFPNTRYNPCLMPALPMVVLCCTSTLLSTGKFFAGNLATDCFQKVRWHLPTAVERAFSVPVSLEGGGLPSYHCIMHSQWCHSLWRNLLFHTVKFCLLIKLIFKTDSMEGYNEAPVRTKKLLIL